MEISFDVVIPVDPNEEIIDNIVGISSRKEKAIYPKNSRENKTRCVKNKVATLFKTKTKTKTKTKQKNE